MPDHRCLIDADRCQQRVRVARQLLEAVLVAHRLAGFAKADLVRRNDAIPGRAEHLDRVRPGRRAEVLSMQQDRGAAVGALRLDIHVSHVHRFALRGECELLDRRRIVEALQLGAIRGAIVSGSQRDGRCGNRCHCEQGKQELAMKLHDSGLG